MPKVDWIAQCSNWKPNSKTKKSSKVFWRSCPANRCILSRWKGSQNQKRKRSTVYILVCKGDESYPSYIIINKCELHGKPESGITDDSDNPFYDCWNSFLVIMISIVSNQLGNINSKRIGADSWVGLSIKESIPRSVTGFRNPDGILKFE